MRWLISAVVSLLITTFVGLAAAGGWFYWDRVETRGEQAARATLPALAKDRYLKSSPTTSRLSSGVFPRHSYC